MKPKMRECILGAVCFLGFMFLLGSVGAIEQDTIPLGQGVLQMIIGLAVFAGAAYWGGFMQ